MVVVCCFLHRQHGKRIPWVSKQSQKNIFQYTDPLVVCILRNILELNFVFPIFAIRPIHHIYSAGWTGVLDLDPDAAHEAKVPP